MDWRHGVEGIDKYDEAMKLKNDGIDADRTECT